MDAFDQFQDSVESPARQASAIVPHDATALPRITKALYIGHGGDITLRAVGSEADCLFAAVPGGTILPVRASHVRATGTSATAIVALA